MFNTINYFEKQLFCNFKNKQAEITFYLVYPLKPKIPPLFVMVILIFTYSVSGFVVDECAWLRVKDKSEMFFL